ncbi:MAG: hypothetical protein ACM3UU_08395 [Ignavibacteriales bacterium]
MKIAELEVLIMGYKVNVLTKCANEEETAVVIAAALSAVLSDQDKANDGLIIRKINRKQGGMLPWNIIAKRECFERIGGN